MANVGKNIKMFRTRKQLTQEAFAEKLFVSRQTVSNYENNKSNPDIDMLVKIAEVLETDVNTLIYGETEQIRKKRQIIKLTIMIIATVILGVAVFILKEKTRIAMTTGWDVTAPYLYYAIVPPVFWVVVGWVFVELFFTFLKVQPIKKNICKWICRITIGVLICYVILILPSCIGLMINQIQYQIAYHQWELSGASEVFWFGRSWSFIPWWDSLAAWVVIYLAEGYAVLFTLPGMFLSYTSVCFFQQEKRKICHV